MNPHEKLPPAPSSRLQKQLEFLLTADKLKAIERRTYVSDGSRHENSAEHSWHLALALLLFREYADEEIDPFRALQMAVLHDLVEIYAGDTYVYDAQAMKNRAQKELEAAEKLFSRLPDDQNAEFRAIWEEFEAKQTPTAKFAGAVDRLVPVFQNFVTDGQAWRDHEIRVSQVEEIVGSEMQAAPKLGDYLQILLASAGEKGFLKKDEARSDLRP